MLKILSVHLHDFDEDCGALLLFRYAKLEQRIAKYFSKNKSNDGEIFSL